MKPSSTEFFTGDNPDRILAVRDAAGRATGLVLHQGGQDLPAKKIRIP